LNPVLQAILDFVISMWENWSSLIAAPFNTPNLLWIIIPIWITWFFTERYQELHKTSLGNAITNGAVVLWVSIDWIRMLTNILTENARETFDTGYAIKYGLAVIAFVYGSLIIFFGIKRNKVTHYLGRIREVTYIMVTFSPMVYGVVEITWQAFLSILFFFPVFYFIIELFNKIMPKPKTYEIDAKEDTKGSFNDNPSFGSDSSSSDPFASKKSDDPFAKPQGGDPFANPQGQQDPFATPNPMQQNPLPMGNPMRMQQPQTPMQMQEQPMDMNPQMQQNNQQQFSEQRPRSRFSDLPNFEEEQQ
jgi:hypothetical protein